MAALIVVEVKLAAVRRPRHVELPIGRERVSPQLVRHADL